MKNSWCNARTVLIISVTTLSLMCICVHTKPTNTNTEDHSTHHFTIGVKPTQFPDNRNTKNIRDIHKSNSEAESNEQLTFRIDPQNPTPRVTGKSVKTNSTAGNQNTMAESGNNGDMTGGSGLGNGSSDGNGDDNSAKINATDANGSNKGSDEQNASCVHNNTSSTGNSNSSNETSKETSNHIQPVNSPRNGSSNPGTSRASTMSVTSPSSSSTSPTDGSTNDDCSSTKDITLDEEEEDVASGTPSLRLERGRYEGVVVHVDDHVAEDQLLLQNIKDLFNNTQKSLKYSTRPNGTGDGFIFGSVTVTVPSTWSAALPWLQTPLASPSVLVAPSNPQHGHIPYTVQAGGCGEGGMHIHFTPDYIRNMSHRTVKEMIGNPAAVLMHEWAHFRWGVFDEYVERAVDKRGALVKPFYLDENMQIKPSACPLNLKGWIVKTGTNPAPTNATAAAAGALLVSKASPAPLLQQCLTTTDEGLPPPDCFFYPNVNQSIKTVSRMSYASENQTKKFCGSTEVPHNSAAPTPHNLQCGGRSVWEVMLDHPDFARRSCGQTKKKCLNKDTTIKFEVFRRPRPQFVLVIVHCNALVMEHFESLKQDIMRFQHSLSPASLQLFAVTSNSLNPYPVSDAEQLNCDVGGNRAALTATAEALKSSVPLIFFGSVVVVSSAGFTPKDHDTFRRTVTSFNRTAAARPTVVTAVSVDTPCPETHPRFTCVEHHPGQDEADMSDVLRRTFRASDLKDGLQLVSTERHSLWSALPSLGSETNVTGKFVVNFCSGDALLVVLAVKSPNLTVTLKRDGTSPAPPAYTTKVFKDNRKDVTVVKISCDTGYGDWQYVLTYGQHNLTTDPPEDANIPHATVKFYQELDKKIAVSIDTRIFVKKPKVMVDCNKTNNEQDQVTNAPHLADSSYVSPNSTEMGTRTTHKPKMENTTLKNETEIGTHSTQSYNLPTSSRNRRHAHVDSAVSKVSYDSSVRIVARLCQGETQQDPILGANVTAVISKDENNTSASIPLHDSGIGADIVAGDGVYSGFLTGLTGNGRYHVTVEASSGSAARRVVHTNDDTFWMDQQQTTNSNFSSDSYLVKVKCFSNHTGNQLQLMFAKKDSNGTKFLTELKATYEDGSLQKHFTGRVLIPSSGRLVVPKACIVVTISKDSSPPSLSPSPRSAHGSRIPVLPRINDPVELFKSNSSTNFSLHTDDEAVDDANANKNSRGARSIKRIDELFELTVDANEFKVIEEIKSFELVSYSSRDLIPPSRVRDLVVTRVHYLRPAVDLQWTSPGDDYFAGTAASLELRYHRLQSALQQQFSTASAVLEGTHVKHEALRPVPGETQQRLTVLLKDYSLDTIDTDFAVYFALRAQDEAGNVGGLSNVAEARFTVTARNKRLQESNSRLHVAVPILGAVVLVVLVTVVLIKLKHRRRSVKKAQYYDGTLELTGSIPSFLIGINSKNKPNLQERSGHSPHVLHATKAADGYGQMYKHQDQKDGQSTGCGTYPRKGEASTAKHDQMSSSYMRLCEIPLNSNLSEHSEVPIK